MPARFELDNAESIGAVPLGDAGKYEVFIGITKNRCTLVYKCSFVFRNYSGSELSESIIDVKSPVISSKNTSFNIHSIANSYNKNLLFPVDSYQRVTLIYDKLHELNNHTITLRQSAANQLN